MTMNCNYQDLSVERAYSVLTDESEDNVVIYRVTMDSIKLHKRSAPLIAPETASDDSRSSNALPAISHDSNDRHIPRPFRDTAGNGNVEPFRTNESRP